MSTRVLFVVTLFALGAGLGSVPSFASPAATAREAQSYSTFGVVKSFGKDRAYVNIAHDDVPGFMNAMTMSFEPRSKEQLVPLSVGDRVKFKFTVTDDGRRLIDHIVKP